MCVCNFKVFYISVFLTDLTYFLPYLHHFTYSFWQNFRGHKFLLVLAENQCKPMIYSRFISFVNYIGKIKCPYDLCTPRTQAREGS